MYAFAERFKHDQHKPPLSPTALKLAPACSSVLAFGSVFLERDRGDTACWSLSRVIKAADGKDLPSSRFQLSWKVEAQDVCVSQARYVYSFKRPAAWTAFSITAVSPFIKNKGVWGGREVGVINLI